MKKIAILLLATTLLSSCADRESVVEGNPVVEQINIATDGNYKYEVYFKVKNNSPVDSKMMTNFRYQVGDTLISYYEFFDVKLNGLRDSLRFYTKLTDELRKENVRLKTNLDFLIDKKQPSEPTK